MPRDIMLPDGKMRRLPAGAVRLTSKMMKNRLATRHSSIPPGEEKTRRQPPVKQRDEFVAKDV